MGEEKPVSMGDCDDFSMLEPGKGKTAGGVCHACPRAVLALVGPS